MVRTAIVPDRRVAGACWRIFSMASVICSRSGFDGSDILLHSLLIGLHAGGALPNWVCNRSMPILGGICSAVAAPSSVAPINLKVLWPFAIRLALSQCLVSYQSLILPISICRKLFIWLNCFSQPSTSSYSSHAVSIPSGTLRLPDLEWSSSRPHKWNFPRMLWSASSSKCSGSTACRCSASFLP